MKALLLGANGQLGCDILSAYRLRQPRYELFALTRKDLDVSRLEEISTVLAGYDFDVLINCTSYHKTDEVEKNASLAFAINTHAVKAMAEACQARGARFVHISTDYVFSGETDSPYTETDHPRPINVYGASKAMGETLAQLAHDRIYILRVASLFGVAGASGKGGNFVETMLRIAREKGEIRVVDDITMSPTSTADLASMILTLIERDPPPGIYHAVNSGSATWYEFACDILARAGVRAKTIPLTSQEFSTVARRPRYSVLSNRKLTGVVGAIPDWSNALERYLRLKQHSA